MTSFRVVKAREIRCAVVLLALAGGALAEDTGTIKGKVTFKGGREAVPEKLQPKVIQGRLASPECTKAIGTNKARVAKKANGSGVRWVLVSIDKGLGETKCDPPTAPVVLNQVNCEYVPHVLGIVKGQELVVRNSDSGTHNVNGLTKKNAVFNISQPAKTKDIKLKFSQVERFYTKCDVHNWMGCYIEVFDHPFFSVSDKTGVYEIKNVPVGKYTLKFWHESFGEKTMAVEIPGPGATAEVNVEFDAPK